MLILNVLLGQSGTGKTNLNTSYVDIKRRILPRRNGGNSNLNTSYVDIKRGRYNRGFYIN